jgi:hypothetical protein
MSRIGADLNIFRRISKPKKGRYKMHRLRNLLLTATIVLLTTAISFLSVYSQKTAGDAVSALRDGPAAETTGRGSKSIEGVWNATVTIRNCQNGTPITSFKAMDLFVQGGSVVDTNAAPPNTRGPGFGTWEFLGEHQFASTIRFFLYNPDGTFAGVRRIAQDITVGEDNNTWESTVSITVYNPAGDLTSTACATAAAQRAE